MALGLAAIWAAVKLRLPTRLRLEMFAAFVLSQLKPLCTLAPVSEIVEPTGRVDSLVA